MRTAILEAKEYIYLESYILFEDPRTRSFFQALKDKARAGVKVKMVIDQLGSFWVGSLSLSEYAQQGIEILFFRRLWNRNHRKVLIVDGKIVFLGGVNIKGKYAKWLDLHFSLSDRFLIQKILRSFARVYQLAGGIDPTVAGRLKDWRAEKQRRALYKAKIFFIEHWPFRKRSALKNYYERKIVESRESIVMVTPYFIPHRWLIAALDRAIRRGVSVEVLLPKKTDVALLNTANWIFAEELSDRMNPHTLSRSIKSHDNGLKTPTSHAAKPSGIREGVGIKFLFLPEMNHAKVLLVDGKEGMVGSNNIDAQSFDLNLETGVIFQQKNMILDLKQILETWRSSATPYNQLPPWRPWYYRIVKFFIKLIRPLL